MKGLKAGKFHIYSIIESSLLKLPLVQFLDEICEAGVSIIQLRDKFATARQRYETALTIKKVIDKRDIIFIINDSIDIALATEAHGVHLGVKDIPIDVARANFGDLIIGYSCNNISDMALANAYADYAGIGPCYHTDTKSDLREVLSYDELGQLRNFANVSTFAIGGINDNNINNIKMSGVDGVVVASYLLKSDSPYQAIKKLLEDNNERV